MYLTTAEKSFSSCKTHRQPVDQACVTGYPTTPATDSQGVKAHIPENSSGRYSGPFYHNLQCDTQL